MSLTQSSYTLPVARTALDHLVLILRCDGLHTSRQLACRSLEVLTGVLESGPPAVRAAGPNGSSVLEWNEQGVWTPLGAEPSSLTWKTLLSSDMAAAGAAEGTGDRGRTGGHRLPSSLALLLHLLEGASQPTSRQRPQGDVMLLQYLVRVLRRDLDARIQVIRHGTRGSFRTSSLKRSPMCSCVLAANPYRCTTPFHWHLLEARPPPSRAGEWRSSSTRSWPESTAI